MYSDTISDLLTRIRNGYMAKKTEVVIPHSKMKEAICKVLVEAKYLKDINVNDLDNNKKDLVAVLLYKGKRPAITKINRISKSGIRKFSSSEKLPYVLSGLGDAIISTSQGVMTASAARKRRLGGEIICKVW